MTQDLEAAILADSHLSVREAARKHGVSKATVSRIRIRFERGPIDVSDVSVPTETQKRVQHWLEVAELVLHDVGQLVRRAANDPEAHKNPDMIRAIAGGAKIMSDAVNGRLYLDLGRNKGGNAFAGHGSTITQADLGSSRGTAGGTATGIEISGPA